MKNRRGTRQPLGFWILDEDQERDAPATLEERFWILDVEWLVASLCERRCLWEEI